MITTGDRILLSMPRTEFNRLCALFSAHLEVGRCLGPYGGRLDPLQVLLALGGRESSFGANLKPRFEAAYFIDGALWQNNFELQAFVSENLKAGACSYGPLQVMAWNAHQHGFSVAEIAADPEAAMAAAVAYFNAYVIGHWKCVTLEQICRTWNGGHPSAAAMPGYYDEVLKYYFTETAANS